MKAVVRVCAAFATLALLIAGAHYLRSVGSGAPDFPEAKISASSAEVVVEIPAGATGSMISKIVYQAGVVKSSEALFRTFVGDKRAARIAPGSHRLTLTISARQALEQLLDHDRIPGLIAIFEGEWNSEVTATMRSQGYPAKEVTAALNSAPPGFKTTEGLIFPAHYSFEKGTTAQTAIKAMVARGLVEAKSAGIFATQEKFTPVQLLTIASIVQQEGDGKDFRKISQVLRNRLKIGMKLQLDSTVHYIKKVRGSVFLSTESTFINSPYNTYQRYGLPPAPIGNPGKAAMAAAVNPEPGNWLYFITVKPGDTRFTDSLDEFNRWKIEYKKNLKAGAFK